MCRGTSRSVTRWGESSIGQTSLAPRQAPALEEMLVRSLEYSRSVPRRRLLRAARWFVAPSVAILAIVYLLPLRAWRDRAALAYLGTKCLNHDLSLSTAYRGNRTVPAGTEKWRLAGGPMYSWLFE
jgi:hypothetical protein